MTVWPERMFLCWPAESLLSFTHTMKSHYIGIDLGGTKILAAIATAQGKILARSKKRTLPKKSPILSPEDLTRRIAEMALEVVKKAGLSMDDIVAAGIGAPGPTNIHTGMVFNAVNLPGWEQGFALGPSLARHLGCPVWVDNDVNVGLLGEATYGAAQGIADVMGLFVGTGLGGAIILDGKLRRGFRWGAGEVGHTYLHYPGKMPINVEDVASRGAISKRLAEAMQEGKSPILAELVAKRKDGRITSGVIRKALAAGDATTQAAVAQVQEALAVLIASITNLLDPQAFVMGGGLVESLGDAFLVPIRERTRSLFFVQVRTHEVRIMPAGLGDEAGVLGAVALAQAMQK